MKTLTRRDFIKYSSGSGLFLLSGINPISISSAQETRVKEVTLNARITDLDLGNGKTFKAWTYNGLVPGPEIRVKEGERLRVTLRNDLSEETTIHWHGLPVPNSMDGVPDVTQKAVQPGETFVYDFVASPPGTYIYHSHASYQLDRGLYGNLIVEPLQEQLSYDREYTIALEDWAITDGGGPEASRAGRIAPMGMGMGMSMSMMQSAQHREDHPLREPYYDVYTLNGRIFEATAPITVKKGERLRLRITNPSSSTFYTIRIGGHPLTITHSDGRPINPLKVDAVRIGMGERYDVLLNADNPGLWLIYNLQDGSPVGGKSLGVLSYNGIQRKTFDSDPLLRPRINDYSMMEGQLETSLQQVEGPAEKSLRMTLSGGMMGNPYWTINGNAYPDSRDINVRQGDRVRFEYFNQSMMAHPMHLHGHFFEVVGTGQRTGVRIKKDTLIIPASMGQGAIEFVAGSPGIWFHHCHHLYHMMGGMANLVRVV